MKLFLLIAFFCIVNAAHSQQAFAAKRLSTAQVPSLIKYRGKLVEAWSWKDQAGENVLVLSTTTPVASKSDDEGMTTELFASHFIKKDTAFRLRWKLNDLVKDCPLDYVCEFLKGSTSITDLDKDGTAETTLQYQLACRGDVSPSAMKLIMHEDSVKYALRGSRWIRAGEGETFTVTEKDVNLEKFSSSAADYTRAFGRYETEKEFAKAPSSFLIFARKQWLKYARETE